MDYNQIRILLDKYWDGETSVQEENLLRDFFAGNDIPDDLKPYQPLFRFFKMEQAKKLDADFDQKLIGQLQSTGKGKTRVIKLPLLLMRVAAVGLLVVSIYFVGKQQFSKPDVVVTEEMTPEEAYAKTKEALLLVSAKMNKGTDLANAGMSKMAKATSVLK